MLRRVYVDNFKALVNFDLEIGPLTLLLGPNGAGKSTAFEAIRLVRDFVRGESTTNDLFLDSSLTRWQQSDVQTFELTIDGMGGSFVYRLEIEHEPERERCRVRRQMLTFDGRPLYESDLDHAQLYRDDHSKGPSVLCDWTRSGIAAIQPRHDNTRLYWFKQRINRIYVLRMDPIRMGARSERESTNLSLDSSNFVSWFRHVTQTNLNLMGELGPLLRDVFGGFDSLSLAPDGTEARVLKVRFRLGESDGASAKFYDCRFDELSDGQRVLIALYTLLTAADDEDYTLCVDEPENFVALREIQPWLNLLIDKSQSGSCQAVLISHHPEFINTLAVASGRWLDRAAGGPVRVQSVSDEGTGLPISELVARGWLHV